MHPAPSIILFTVLSGLGFGMIAWLGLDVPAPRGWAALVFFFIAFTFAVSGLSASAFHLGHPERALKAFTQWRSSWLSREAWAAAVTLALAGLYAVGLIFFGERWRAFGVTSGLAALATVFATSMIYMQMRTIPRWNHWSPPVVFIGWSLAGGALLTGRVWPAIALLLIMTAVQAVAWLDQRRRERISDTSIATATGLGYIGHVRALEPPHTGSSYLTNEMVYRIGRKHAHALRIIGLGLAGPIPALALSLPFSHLVALLAAISHLAGLLVIRWLFFAEARHVVSTYYGR